MKLWMGNTLSFGDANSNGPHAQAYQAALQQCRFCIKHLKVSLTTHQPLSS